MGMDKKKMQNFEEQSKFELLQKIIARKLRETGYRWSHENANQLTQLCKESIEELKGLGFSLDKINI